MQQSSHDENVVEVYEGQDVLFGEVEEYSGIFGLQEDAIDGEHLSNG